MGAKIYGFTSSFSLKSSSESHMKEPIFLHHGLNVLKKQGNEPALTEASKDSELHGVNFTLQYSRLSVIQSSRQLRNMIQ